MSQPKAPVVPKSLLVPFILVTLLFPLWGFANDITNPMVAAFKNILLLTNFESSLVQGAFYGGYALMAIPAAIFIKKFSYKSGILLGLALYAFGCLLFIPAGWSLNFYPFLLAYLIMTSGLSFLETTANPYVLSMGDESTSTRRLNLAQAFNPMGSIVGMFVASMIILVNLDGTTEDSRRKMVAASEGGESLHAQMVEKISGDIEALRRTTAGPGWESKKRLAKKAKEQAEAIASDIALTADPKADRIASISAELARQPAENKFQVAIRSVAIVLQLREPLVPTAAEKEQQELFGGPGGMQLAGLLHEESMFIANEPGHVQTVAALKSAGSPAKQIRDLTAGIYDALGKHKNDVGAAAGARSNAEGVRHLLDSLTTDLGAARQAIATIPAGKLQPHFDALGQRFAEVREKDLSTVVGPYAIMGFVLLGIFGLFAWKLPAGKHQEGGSELHLGPTFRRLLSRPRYWEGVLAQTFYVGAQIMVWTFIIQYAELELGISKTTAQNCNILAMVIFVSSRFICTFLLHYISPGLLLGLLALGGIAFTAGAVFIHGYVGLYSLMAVSACMSLMFPTIYGIALKGLGDDAKLASSGLILAIGGGCLLPLLQGKVLDMPPFDLGFVELSSVRASFLLPLVCFIFIAIYGFRTLLVYDRREA
jgi:fucose permease